MINRHTGPEGYLSVVLLMVEPLDLLVLVILKIDLAIALYSPFSENFVEKVGLLYYIKKFIHV